MTGNKITHLYRHFDQDGKLLYVGISKNALVRLGQHSDNSHWFDSIALVKIEIFPSRAEALLAERNAIASENPAHNLLRPTAKAKKEFVASRAEESSADIVKRIAQFNPAYSLDEVARVLGVSTSIVKIAIDKGNMGCCAIEKPSRRNKKGETITPKKYIVTGWQLIEYLEHLQEEKVHQL